MENEFEARISKQSANIQMTQTRANDFPVCSSSLFEHSNLSGFGFKYQIKEENS